MVYQMPCPTEQLLFVASTLDDENRAESEIAQWAQENGYLPPRNGHYVIYEGGTEAREWRLIERRRQGPPSGSGTGH